jgi:hypothetical protein
MRRLIFRPHPSHQSFLEHRNQDFLFGSVSPGIGTLLHNNSLHHNVAFPTFLSQKEQSQEGYCDGKPMAQVLPTL